MSIIPNHKKQLHGIDHLRALAICSVFLFHYSINNANASKWLFVFTKFGWTGVDLFFVISGFLISSQLFQNISQGKKISFRDFFLKRCFRILPAYYFVVIIYYGIPIFREKESLSQLWRFLFFTFNFNLDTQIFGTFSHAWSLCVEEHFYFVLPILLILVQKYNLLKKSYWILLFIFLLGFFIRLYSYVYLYEPTKQLDNSWMYWYKYIYFPTYNRLDGLLIGISIATVYQFLPNFWQKIANYGNLFILLGIIILTIAFYMCYEPISFKSSIFGFPMIALGYGFLVLGSICNNSFLYKSKSSTTTLIATLSYSIYLVHQGVTHMVKLFLTNFEWDNILELPLCIISILIVSFCLHNIIEKPFMKLRKQII